MCIRDRYELNNEFYASVENDEGYWLECSISKEKPTNSSTYSSVRKDIYTCDFGFRVHKKYNQNGDVYKRQHLEELKKATENVKLEAAPYLETPVTVITKQDKETTLGERLKCIRKANKLTPVSYTHLRKIYYKRQLLG